MICMFLLFVFGFVLIFVIFVCNVVDLVVNGVQIVMVVFVVIDQCLFIVIEVSCFDQFWVMIFLFDGSLLVIEKCGKLQYLDLVSGQKYEIIGVLKVVYGGQGGFGDIILYLDFVWNYVVYVSYVEEGMLDIRGVVVVWVMLVLDVNGGG